jgi:hypothetical protein
MNLTLPVDSQVRKDIPIYSGFLKYFPAAIAGAARHSKRGNDKHNPGQELHHARGKSMDHADCIQRHLVDMADLEAIIERGGFDDKRDQEVVMVLLEEADALVWRSAALSQKLYETYAGKPLAPAAREPKSDARISKLQNGDRVKVIAGGSYIGRRGKIIGLQPSSSQGVPIFVVEFDADFEHSRGILAAPFYASELIICE